MNELVLHHYATSPFSEKVRLVFGAKRLAWCSVHIPVMMPKPDVIALTGGYRKTPLLQVGADVYCDTALICRLLDALHPEPPLYPPAVAGTAQMLAQWADSTLFWTVVPYTTRQPAGIASLFGGSPEALKAFAADRMSFAPHMPRLSVADGAVALQHYLGWLESQLGDGRGWLLRDTLASRTSRSRIACGSCAWRRRWRRSSTAIRSCSPGSNACSPSARERPCRWRAMRPSGSPRRRPRTRRRTSSRASASTPAPWSR